MSLPTWLGRPRRPLPLLVVLLGLSLPPFTLLLIGPAHFALVLLGPATLLVLWNPLFIIAIPLMLSPLLGRTSEETIGPLNAMAFLALWTAGVGGIAAVGHWRKLLREPLFAAPFGTLLLTAVSIGVSSHKGTSLEELIRGASSLMMLLVVYLYARRE